VFAIRYDLAESRVVAGDWRFLLRRPVTGWPVDGEIALAVYNETMLDVNDEFVAEVVAGGMTEQEREARLYHETMRRIAEWGRFTYRRERLEAGP
jgi:hypothetical protein